MSFDYEFVQLSEFQSVASAVDDKGGAAGWISEPLVGSLASDYACPADFGDGSSVPAIVGASGGAVVARRPGRDGGPSTQYAGYLFEGSSSSYRPVVWDFGGEIIDVRALVAARAASRAGSGQMTGISDGLYAVGWIEIESMVDHAGAKFATLMRQPVALDLRTKSVRLDILARTNLVSGRLTGVNKWRVAVGEGGAQSGPFDTAFRVWPSRAPMLKQPNGDSWSFTAISDTGLVVGSRSDAAMSWAPGDDTVVDLLQFKAPRSGEMPLLIKSSTALAVSNEGTIVGSALVHGETGRRAFVWKNGEWRFLDDIVARPDWELREATGVNDLGVITGWGVQHQEVGTQRCAFMLVPSWLQQPAVRDEFTSWDEFDVVVSEFGGGLVDEEGRLHLGGTIVEGELHPRWSSVDNATRARALGRFLSTSRVDRTANADPDRVREAVIDFTRRADT